MIDLLGHVVPDAGPPTAFKGGSPRACTEWKVATWYAPDGRWKLWREDWTTREAAEQSAARIGRIRGHTHYVILRIDYPGLETAL